MQNIRVGGYANVGIECSTPEDAAAADAIIAERGTAKLSNFYDDTADKHGGSGSLYVYRGGEVKNVAAKGNITAREGAILKGSLTCGSVDLQGVTPQSNITIKWDLRDHAVANYLENFYDINGALVKTVEYFANYTTRTTLYGEDADGRSTYTYSYGTFDNKDGRFDMRDWKYTFSAYLGTVDALALPYITVDFGGMESEFGGGRVTFDYPSTTRDIQFMMSGDKRKWHEVWEDYWGYDLGAYQGYIVYDPTLRGELADVLWLENGDSEEVEYTVALPSGIMGGATIDASVDGGVGGDAELKGSTLVVKGSVDTGDVTVSAGGALHLSGDAEFSGVAVDYGALLTIAGNGRYDLTDDIRIAGKLNAGRNIYGSGHKIRFEQYKQTAEFQDFLDDVAFVSDMDKLVGDVLEVEIDSEAYGEYKIADTANYFDGTITVVSHNDSSSAAGDGMSSRSAGIGARIPWSSLMTGSVRSCCGLPRATMRIGTSQR